MGESLLSQLTPALVQTFSTILVGYAFGRWRVLPPEGVAAMGKFITLLALPALLLRNMTTLQLSHIEWDFFLAILIAKTGLFFAVALLTLLAGRCSRRARSDAGIFSIFVTQSNDLAQGLPILTALFSKTHPDYPSLLYVIAPISLVWLNTVGFILMELGREPPTAAALEAESANQHEMLPGRPPSSPSPQPMLVSSSSAPLPLAAGGLTSNAAIDAILAEDDSSDSDSDSESESEEETEEQRRMELTLSSALSVVPDMRRSNSASGRSVLPLNAPSASAGEPSMGRRLRSILKRVFLNPVVVSSLLGICANFALGGKIPPQIDSFLAALGNTFSALALFILGVGMNGKLALFQDRRKLFLPLLLIAAKSLVLPVLIRLVIAALGADGSSDLTLVAFLTGTLPTAPSVPFFASEFGAHSAELMGPAMVLGTFIAAPIMFISAQLTTVQVPIESISAIVGDSTRISSGFGMAGAIYCIICFIYNKRWHSTRERLLLTTCALQVSYTLSVQFCVTAPESHSAAAAVRFFFVRGSSFAVYVWMALMAVNELVRRFHGTRAERALFIPYNLIGLLLVALPVGSLLIFGEYASADMPFCTCWNRYGHAQWWVTVLLMSLCFAVIAVGLIQLRGDATFDPSASADTQPHIDIDRKNQLRESLLQQHDGSASLDASLNSLHDLASPPPYSPPPMHNGSDLPVSSASPPQEASWDSAPSRSIDAAGNLLSDAEPTEEGEYDTDLSRASLAGRPSRRSRRRALTASAAESFWLFAMKLQLFGAGGSLFLAVALYIWSADLNGVRVEFMLLDAVTFATMGVWTCALFALNQHMKSPLSTIIKAVKKRLKRRTRKTA